MTGPLAPQFAQVRLAMSYPRPSYAHTGQYLGRHEAPKQVAADALAALSVIERHVQEMTDALEQIASMSFYVPATEKRSILNAKWVSRAALSALDGEEGEA